MSLEKGRDSRNPLEHLKSSELLSVLQRQLEIEDLKARVELTALQNVRESTLQMIEANERDRKDQRNYQVSKDSKSLTLLLGLLIVVTAFRAFALWIGKDAIVVDALKVIAGGFAGYGLGRVGRKKTSDHNASD